MQRLRAAGGRDAGGFATVTGRMTSTAGVTVDGGAEVVAVDLGTEAVAGSVRGVGGGTVAVMLGLNGSGPVASFGLRTRPAIHTTAMAMTAVPRPHAIRRRHGSGVILTVSMVSVSSDLTAPSCSTWIAERSSSAGAAAPFRSGASARCGDSVGISVGAASPTLWYVGTAWPLKSG